MSIGEHDLSFQKKLRKEIDLWLSDGLISSEQKRSILARYSALAAADEKAGPGKLVTTISVLGSILIGLGILLFIGSNWSAIPVWSKLFIIFAAMLVSYAAGFYLRYEKKNFPKVGAALILLGAIIFGAGIFLVAQIYNITVHYPNGPLMWGLAVLPLAYLLRLKPILYLSILTLLIWLGMEASFHTTLAYRDFIPLVSLYLIAGALLWSLGIMHKSLASIRDIASPYLLSGLIISFGAGYILTFDISGARMGDSGLQFFYAVIAVIFVISVMLIVSARNFEKGIVAEIIFLSAIIITVIIACLVYTQSEFPGRKGHDFELITFIVNLVFAAAIIGIIYLGYMRHSIIYINVGLIFFVLDLIARYFDFFWKLLPRSLFFILGGIVLLAGGIMLEKKRRKILASFQLQESG